VHEEINIWQNLSHLIEMFRMPKRRYNASKSKKIKSARLTKAERCFSNELIYGNNEKVSVIVPQPVVRVQWDSFPHLHFIAEGVPHLKCPKDVEK